MRSEHKISLRTVVLLHVLAIVSGCATYPDQQDPKIPADVEPLFSTCAPTDGALALKVFDGESVLGVAEAEWIAPGDSWTVQMLSPLGQTILTLKVQDSALTASGALATKLPSLAIREDGFLEVDGHFVAVKASEFPCLLAGTLPQAWRTHLKAVEQDGPKQRLWFDDGDRVTKVTTIRPLAGPKPRMFCAQTKWGSFFFGNKLVVCQELNGRKHTSVKGIGSYRIEWVPL